MLIEEHSCDYLTHKWPDKDFHTFPKIIGPKMNIIVRLMFELA